MPRPLGQLRHDATPDVVMMVCTAGHVDHGKTKLIKLLTGCETDRLRAEKERGLTIELGFAPCCLGGDLCIGIVDVPGHEKFVRTMVSGVSGIDMTILVIAADDGVMPQTVEHLQIMELLGVCHGMVALTKTDLVSPSLVQERIGEIREFLRGGFLAGAPICAVSSETGAGFVEFYGALIETAGAVRERKTRGPGVFRMPVDRVFNPQGFGTVVTGIPVAGSVRVGAEVELAPGHVRSTVRGIQCFLRDADTGSAGQCLALNVPDFDGRTPLRGRVVGVPGYLEPSRFLSVRLRVLPGIDRPLRNAEPIRFQTGTVEAAGKVYLLEGRQLGGGEQGFATVALTEPIAAAVGDRSIVRRLSPAGTVAGGPIVALSPGDRRPGRRVLVEQLRSRDAFLAATPDVPADAARHREFEYALFSSASPAVTLLWLAKRTLLPLSEAEQAVKVLSQSGRALALAAGRWVHSDRYAACMRELRNRLEAACDGAGQLTMSLTDLRRGLDWAAPLWRRLLSELEQEQLIAVKGDTLLLMAAAGRLSDADRAVVQRLCLVYEESAFQSPRPGELPELLNAAPATVTRLLDYLCQQGALVRLNRNVILARRHFRHARDLVVRTIRECGVLDSADFKREINSSRKYAIAILDYLDAQRVTTRSGNSRRLTPNYEKSLT